MTADTFPNYIFRERQCFRFFLLLKKVEEVSMISMQNICVLIAISFSRVGKYQREFVDKSQFRYNCSKHCPILPQTVAFVPHWCSSLFLKCLLFLQSSLFFNSIQILLSWSLLPSFSKKILFLPSASPFYIVPLIYHWSHTAWHCG